MNDEGGLLSDLLSPFIIHKKHRIIHHCFTLPCLIRDVEKREAGKIGSQEVGKKRRPFGLILNACGDKKRSW
jgi:hypothetical protein